MKPCAPTKARWKPRPRVLHPEERRLCLVLNSCNSVGPLVRPIFLIICPSYRYDTRSTAQGGGGSFKDRTSIGEMSCGDSWMAERTDGPKGGWHSESLFSLSLSIYASICLTVYLSICRICRSVYLSIHISVCLSICLSIYLPTYLSIWLSIYLSIYLSLYLSVCLSIYLSIYLSISISIYLLYIYCISI